MTGEISDAHVNGDIHIHDLSMLTSYSCGWSLRKLLLDGLGGITGKITASPAKHLATLCNQMVNFLGIMQNEWAASQSFSSFDTYLAPFIKADSLSYDKVKKCMEAFVLESTPPAAGVPRAPFSHIFMDLKVPGTWLAKRPLWAAGEWILHMGIARRRWTWSTGHFWRPCWKAMPMAWDSNIPFRLMG